MTKAIKTIEVELGAQLFHREGERILLSDFGRSLLLHFQHIVQETGATRTLADNFRLLNNVPVRLGVMSTIGPVRLSRFLAKFQNEFHGVEVAVSEGSAAELKSMLERAELDLAILKTLNGLRDAFNVHDLYKERYVVIFLPDHRLAKLNAVKLSDRGASAWLAASASFWLAPGCADRRGFRGRSVAAIRPCGDRGGSTGATSCEAPPSVAAGLRLDRATGSSLRSMVSWCGSARGRARRRFAAVIGALKSGS